MNAFQINQSLDTAWKAVEELDSARFSPVLGDEKMLERKDIPWDGVETFYVPPGTQVRQVNKYRFVVNNRTNEDVNVVRSRYAIIQHKDAASMTLAALQSCGIGQTARYQVLDLGNRMRMRILFPDVVVDDGSLGGLHLGMNVSNSYDQSSSFRAELLAWRVVCSNGMIIRHRIPGASFSMRHVGSVATGYTKTVEQIAKYTARIEKAGVLLEHIVAEARERQARFQTTRQVELTLGAILDRLTAPPEVVASVPVRENVPYYDLYNAVTAFASHDPGLSPQRREEILVRAERFLLGPRELVIRDDPAQMPLAEATSV